MIAWIGIIISGLLGITNLILVIVRDKGSGEKERRKEIVELKEGLMNTQGRLGVIEMQMSIFWKGVSFSAAQVLHSPHTPELDVLIEKFQRDQIDDQELKKFKGMLEKIAEDDSNKLHQKAARDVLTLIKVRYEITPELVESTV